MRFDRLFEFLLILISLTEYEIKVPNVFFVIKRVYFQTISQNILRR